MRGTQYSGVMNARQKLEGRKLLPLSQNERIECYEHVLYELTSAFCLPQFDQHDSEIAESAYLRVMVATRNLYAFFAFSESRRYFPDCVAVF